MSEASECKAVFDIGTELGSIIWAPVRLLASEMDQLKAQINHLEAQNESFESLVAALAREITSIKNELRHDKEVRPLLAPVRPMFLSIDEFDRIGAPTARAWREDDDGP